MLDFDLSVGPSLSRTETKGDDAGVCSQGSTTQLGVTVDGTASLQLSAVTSASVTLLTTAALGRERRYQRDQPHLRHLSRRLSPRLAADANLLAQRQVQVQSDTGGDRDFFQASAGLSYALTERVDVGLRYRWRHEHEDGGDAHLQRRFRHPGLAPAGVPDLMVSMALTRMDANPLSLRDYLLILRRRRWWFLVPFLLVLAVAGAAAVLWPPTYRSEATVLIEETDVPQDLSGPSPTSMSRSGSRPSPAGSW